MSSAHALMTRNWAEMFALSPRFLRATKPQPNGQAWVRGNGREILKISLAPFAGEAAKLRAAKAR